jgi:copper chaperone CopZ
MTKSVFKVENMHCTSCAMLIEGELEDLGTKPKCNFKSCLLEVEYEEGSMDEEKIKAIVGKLGYSLKSN